MKPLLLGVCGGLLAACATATKAPVANQFAEESDSTHYGEPGIYFAENPGETKVMYADTNAYLLSVDDHPYFLVRTSWNYDNMPASIAKQTDSLEIIVLGQSIETRESSDFPLIDLPTWMHQFPYLQSLGLESMHVSGKSFKRLLPLRDLKEISFTNVTIENTKQALKYLSRLPSLEHIAIDDTVFYSSETYRQFETALPNIEVTYSSDTLP